MAGLIAGAHGRRLTSAALLSTLALTTCLMVVFVPRPSGADQITSLKAQATVVSEQLVQEQLQIGADQQQYLVETEKVAADSRGISEISQQIDADEQQIVGETQAVRQQAIMTYVDSGAQSPTVDVALFTRDEEAVQAANEYATIAAGNISTAVDQLHTSQRSLEAQQAQLQQQRSQDQADQAQQSADIQQATASSAQLESLQSQVTGQLAAAVAAQAQAQAAAAAAAVAAAQRAASRVSLVRSAGVSASGSSARAPTASTVSGNTSDPALNPYLQCVMRVESGGNYAAVSPNGLYLGAFQFSQSTWNAAAQAAGRSDLVGVPPNNASRADQDTVAVALYSLDGDRPWVGDRCG